MKVCRASRGRRSATELGAVAGILRRGTGGEHPPPRRRLPLGGLGVPGKEETARRQPGGRPAVFFHLRVAIHAAAGRHVAETPGVILVDPGDHHPGFVVELVAQQQGHAPERRNAQTALAFLEEAFASLAPLGPAVLLASQPDGRTNTILGPRIVREAEIADRLHRHLLQISRDTPVAASSYSGERLATANASAGPLVSLPYQ